MNTSETTVTTPPERRAGPPRSEEPHCVRAFLLGFLSTGERNTSLAKRLSVALLTPLLLLSDVEIEAFIKRGRGA